MRAVLILPVGLFYFSTNPKAGSRLDAVYLSSYACKDCAHTGGNVLERSVCCTV